MSTSRDNRGFFNLSSYNIVDYWPHFKRENFLGSTVIIIPVC